MKDLYKFMLAILLYYSIVLGLWQFGGTWVAHRECIKHNVAKVLFVLPDQIYCIKGISVQRLIRGEMIVITTEYPMPLKIWDEDEVSEPIL